ncbi:molybdate ABC transporter substrate-binding protein [Shouchella clausii]|nr:molybdate ABC transporter substrate-binding protein [Shouchella clausii]
MMKRQLPSCACALLFMFLAGCTPSGTSPETDDGIHVMAAASLTDALTKLESMYEEQTGETLVINYGSSGKLRQQINEGAPADVFLSASVADMEQVANAGHLVDSVNLLENKLVLVAAPEVADSLSEWDDLTSAHLRSLAIGQTETVPAGQYAKQSLETLGMWAQLEESLIYGSDVRQVLTYVETGNADAGLVYQTDAETSEQVTIVAEAPEHSHEPIYYPVGLINDDEKARHFYEWLQTDEALAVFEDFGFSGVS